MSGKSPHILNTSATLMGFCMVIITSIRVGNFSAASFIDEVAGISALLLSLSCLFSFMSMKSSQHPLAEKLEYIADAAFLMALICIFLIISMLSFKLFE
jgi:hypothetical protein